MTVELHRTQVGHLAEIVHALSTWQRDGAPVQLHPGDLGWHWRFGAQQVARALRVWSRDGAIVAVGLIDGVGLIRMAVAPECDDDSALAARILADLSDPAQQVLPAGEGAVEARAGAALRALLAERGWVAGDPWIPLHRELTEIVARAGNDQLRVEVVGADRADQWLEVVRAAFGSAAPPADRWPNLAGSLMSHPQRGRCLIGYDDQDHAVAAVAVWSSGPGRPGLLEPMGVHDRHRGRGHGRGITLAAAAELRSMGSSSAVVATPALLTAAVATYVAAGFRTTGAVTDFRRAG